MNLSTKDYVDVKLKDEKEAIQKGFITEDAGISNFIILEPKPNEVLSREKPLGVRLSDLWIMMELVGMVLSPLFRIILKGRKVNDKREKMQQDEPLEDIISPKKRWLPEQILNSLSIEIFKKRFQDFLKQ